MCAATSSGRRDRAPAAAASPHGGRCSRRGGPGRGPSAAERSRTMGAAPPPAGEPRRLYAAVAEAHAAALALARPGTPARDLDAAARGTLARHGLAEYLTLRTGHGLGFAGSEPPNLGCNDPTPLEAGMVISIEPGVCMPDVGGVLWADNYLVTESGAE